MTCKKTYDAIIVGGGVSGLAASFFFQKRFPGSEYLLLEATERWGGKIRTETVHLPSMGGHPPFLLEHGPDSMGTHRSETFEVLSELGLEREVLMPSAFQQPLWLFRQEGLVPFPEGFRLLPERFLPLLRTKLLSFPGKLRASADLLIPPRREEEDESIASFVLRRFGREVLENFTEPLVAGVFHAAPERQSVLACFPHLREMERNSGSILFGICKRRLRQSFHSAGEGPQPLPSPLISFKQGMGSFAKALRLALAGDLLLDAPVASIHLHPEGLWQVETANCGVARARNVILATPAYRSAEILSSDFPSLCDALSAIPYAETALISFILAESSLSFQGSGILTGRESHSPLNAVTVSSNKFLDRAPKGYAVVRASIGGSRRPDLLTHEDRTLFQIAEGELERIFQRRIQPLSRSVQRWPRAVPLLEVGHRSSVENLLKELPGGLMLAGNYLYGTGIADCLSSARRAAYSARG